jgi:hypothetical protein
VVADVVRRNRFAQAKEKLLPPPRGNKVVRAKRIHLLTLHVLHKLHTAVRRWEDARFDNLRKVVLVQRIKRSTRLKRGKVRDRVLATGRGRAGYVHVVLNVHPGLGGRFVGAVN